MNEQKKLILGELKKIVKSTAGEVTSTACALQHSGSPIVAQHKFMDDSMLVVYQNGFAQYSTFRNYTVLRVEDCGAYRYTTSAGECTYSAAYFDTQPWEIRLLLEAEDRIARNTYVGRCSVVLSGILSDAGNSAQGSCAVRISFIKIPFQLHQGNVKRGMINGAFFSQLREESPPFYCFRRRRSNHAKASKKDWVDVTAYGGKASTVRCTKDTTANAENR